ncbi:MAG: serine/threonine protein kinase [Planctomycetes bacterium]|nr:serine/threonine protein kinase [Planctomycetota bacterium]
MSPPTEQEQSLLNAALQLATPRQQIAFLKEACQGDDALRHRIEAMLQARDSAATYPRHSPAPAANADEALSAENSGARIGRYKILQQIGAGGTGVVYLAEQEAPNHRRVALKLIKLGMDTRNVLARFEADRAALTAMDHPNIARILDGGATVTGRPYFVMELVRGVKITEYADAHKLTIRQRLDLFVQVCGAVQHAHQKGVVHRNLKPSNIIISVIDGAAVPKVIDIGIAKAIHQSRADPTLFSAHEQMIGTPAYLSPEQVGLGGLDIDTRSDIYSLGVLLYELLTGQTLFPSGKMHRTTSDEIIKAIREKEPPPPSYRMQSLAEAELNAAAKARSVDAAKLPGVLRDDLDWIVMKALEKDRGRRYESAGGLAADIQRFFIHKPVMAHPPDTMYRLRKVVRRHKLAVAALAIVVAALAIGLGYSTRTLLKEREVRHAQVDAFDKMNTINKPDELNKPRMGKP